MRKHTQNTPQVFNVRSSQNTQLWSESSRQRAISDFNALSENKFQHIILKSLESYNASMIATFTEQKSATVENLNVSSRDVREDPQLGWDNEIPNVRARSNNVHDSFPRIRHSVDQANLSDFIVDRPDRISRI